MNNHFVFVCVCEFVFPVVLWSFSSLCQFVYSEDSDSLNRNKSHIFFLYFQSTCELSTVCLPDKIHEILPWCLLNGAKSWVGLVLFKSPSSTLNRCHFSSDMFSQDRRFIPEVVYSGFFFFTFAELVLFWWMKWDKWPSPFHPFQCYIFISQHLCGYLMLFFFLFF